MPSIAVLGATGTAGSRTVTALADRGVTVVPVSRADGVDLISGHGLWQALGGVDVVIDAANPLPPEDDAGDVKDALSAAALNVVHACTAQRVAHLVHLTIAGIHDPVFDYFGYYAAKCAQDDIVTSCAVPHTLVASTQWFEFATNPAAASFAADHVLVQDWLIQPIAADTVAQVLVHAALNAPTGSPRVIGGPERVRLPELTAALLKRRADPRPVATIAPDGPAALAEGALLAPADAEILGPGMRAWLDTQGVPW